MGMPRLEGGTQKDWDEVRKHTEQPIITIITSTYNVVNDLHWTIDSIKNQSYPNIQWIIADGNSKDGTVEILKEHNDIIDYWFSEPDTGIYDAWNKALTYVKGDWVQFIGAGDEIYEQNTLEKVAPYLKGAYPKYELVYGQVLHISEKERKDLYISGEPWRSYKGKWSTYGRPEIPPHPAIYHHHSLFKRLGFDTSLKISADSFFILQVLQESDEVLFMNIVVDKFVLGGISESYEGYLTIYTETQYIKQLLGMKAPIHIRMVGSIKYKVKQCMIRNFGVKKAMYITDGLRLVLGKGRAWTK